jgi:uncharacterized protein (TIGR00661 family)
MHAVPSLLDLALRGPGLRTVRTIMAEFEPDVVISDSSVWTHHAARGLGIPRIGIDHFGILYHCAPSVVFRDRARAFVQAFTYRRLMGQPERVIVSSFFPATPRRAEVRVVGPLLRPEVRGAVATRGDHLLVYLNNGEYQFTDSMRQALSRLDLPVRVYGLGRRPAEGNLTFCAVSNMPFVRDLASCRALLSTAGNQLAGEAMFLGKPMMVIPENTVEQRLNAATVERLGMGMSVSPAGLTEHLIGEFLRREDFYRARIERSARDGLPETVRLIEQFLAELAGVPDLRPAHHHVESG